MSKRQEYLISDKKKWTVIFNEFSSWSNSILSNLNNFHSLEVVAGGSETQLQVSENLNDPGWRRQRISSLWHWKVLFGTLTHWIKTRIYKIMNRRLITLSVAHQSDSYFDAGSRNIINSEKAVCVRRYTANQSARQWARKKVSVPVWISIVSAVN